MKGVILSIGLLLVAETAASAQIIELGTPHAGRSHAVVSYAPRCHSEITVIKGYRGGVKTIIKRECDS